MFYDSYIFPAFHFLFLRLNLVPALHWIWCNLFCCLPFSMLDRYWLWNKQQGTWLIGLYSFASIGSTVIFIRSSYTTSRPLSVIYSLYFLLDWALLDYVTDGKVSDIITEAILNQWERYQNIQNSPEYNNVSLFRVIMEIFVVNMLDINASLL